jgi:uncharacterized protein (DUF58 family)
MVSRSRSPTIRRVAITAKQRVLDLFAGLYLSTFKGHGLEIEDIRDYVAGDDVRAISWAKMAQYGKPFVKNFREERDLLVFLVVDISASGDIGSGLKSRREMNAEIGALLAFSAVANRDRVGLILFSSEVEVYLPPKRGVKHGVRILKEILERKATHRGTDIGKALAFLARVEKKRAITFLLSDFWSPPFEKELSIATKKNDIVAIRVLDPMEKTLPSVGLVQGMDLESENYFLVDIDSRQVAKFAAWRAQNDEELAHLFARHHASRIDLSTDRDPRPPLVAFFKARKRRR